MTKEIGYLAQMFPHLTMTFVYREVEALRHAGVQIHTFSTWRPQMEELSEEAKDLVKDTFYIFPLNWLLFLYCHILYLFTRPRRYLGTLWFCLTRHHKTFNNRWRTFLHFCEAVYLAKEVERQNIQHLHVHFALNASTLALIVSRLTGTTFSFTAHANDIFCNPILLPEKIKAARFIIAISEYNRQFLYKIVPDQETLDKIHVVHCGIDTDWFSPGDVKTRAEQPTILAVGRLVEKKGYPYLIRACKLLRDQGYDFKCFIIGAGPEETHLKQMIQENALSNYVSLEGLVFQEHLKDYIEKSDVFVLPCVIASDQDMDGIPNTLMEAMAMEIPSISTYVSGIPELIEDRITGLLVPPEDEVALAQAIAQMLEDEELRETVTEAGRAKVIEEFEIKKNTRLLLSIFQGYLADKSP